MTHELTAEEIARVDAIHEALDNAHANGTGRGLRLHLTRSEAHLVFTPEEVRDWPETKARLIAYIRAWIPGECLAFVTARKTIDSYGYHGGLAALKLRYWNGDNRSAEYGLYMTRQHRAYIQATGGQNADECKRCGATIGLCQAVRTANDPGPFCCRNCAAAAERDAKCDEIDAALTLTVHGEDKYSHHRLARSDESARALTEALPANVEARKRMVAALAQELRKPVTPRFPAESRQCRVYRGNDR